MVKAWRSGRLVIIVWHCMFFVFFKATLQMKFCEAIHGLQKDWRRVFLSSLSKPQKTSSSSIGHQNPLLGCCLLDLLPSQSLHRSSATFYFLLPTNAPHSLAQVSVPVTISPLSAQACSFHTNCHNHKKAVSSYSPPLCNLLSADLSKRRGHHPVK